MARPTDAMPVHRPMALALALGSGKAALTRASDATFTVAAPTPCRPRPDVQHDQARRRPHSADAAENRTIPPMNALRRPFWSDSVAADMMNMPIVRL